MRFVIVAVGAPRSQLLARPIREYEQRAARYWPLEIREVREAPARSAPASRVRALEGERLLAAAGGAHVVACDEHGTLLDTREFAAWMREQRQRSRDVAFLLGGAFGLDAAVLERADTRLALARWTMPHEMARLVLAEQLYRAGTLARGEPYHK